MKQTISNRRFSILALLMSVVLPVLGQERVPEDEARGIAARLAPLGSAGGGGPVTVEADVDKPVAYREGKYGFMLIPDKHLTADAVAKGGSGLVPVGQLWLLRLAPASGGAVVTNDKLKLVPMKIEEGEVKVPLCWLAIRGGKEQRELVVFGNGKEPVATAPLRDGGTSSDTPVGVSIEKKDDSASLTLIFAGGKQATFSVKQQEGVTE